MRILLISPNYRRRKALGHQLFRDEMFRHDGYFTTWIDNRSTHEKPVEMDVRPLVDKHQPDIILVCHLQYSGNMFGLVGAGVPTVCWCVDYFPRHYDFKDNILNRHEFDLVFFTQKAFVDRAEQQKSTGRLPSKTRFEWLPFSVDNVVFHDWGTKHTRRRFDATLVMSSHAFEYPNRAEAAYMVEHATETDKCFVSLTADGKDVIRGLPYARLLAESRIVVGSCDQHGSANMRNLEVCAAGAMLLTDEPKDFRALGFEPGVHYVRYEKPAEIPDIIRYYHEPDHVAERERIALAGQKLVLERHTNRVRVKEMFEMMRELIGESA